MSLRQRLIRLVVSWIGVALGVPLLVNADLGVAPFDVLNSGLSDSLGWSFGTAFVVASIVFFATGRALGAALGWPCLAGTVVIGVMVNLVLRIIPEPQHLAARLGFLIVGIAIIGASICLVVSTEMGPGPTEVVMLGLTARGIGITPARWISDGTPLVVGALLGGSIGPGTLVFAIGMAPMVRFGLRRLGYQAAISAAMPTTASNAIATNE